MARVERTAPPPPPRRQAKPRAAEAKSGAVAVKFESNTLDLRGKYAYEIEGPLGHAVDRASTHGSLWVIHGHGTGSLKAKVRELLAEEPAVARWEDAPRNEGGAGCTVAYLK